MKSTGLPMIGSHSNLVILIELKCREDGKTKAYSEEFRREAVKRLEKPGVTRHPGAGSKRARN